MKSGIRIYLLVLALFITAGCRPPTDTSPSTAFINVNLVPMTGEAVLPGQTVLVRDSRIEKVGPSAEVKVPRKARVIDGRGAWLMPSLADMHVHIKEDNELLLYIANGVTTVRDMWGTTGVQLVMGFPDQLAIYCHCFLHYYRNW